MCENEEIEEELSKEELVQGVIEEIKNGGCAVCNISELFDIAYEHGKKDALEFIIGVSEEVLEED